MDMFNPGFPLIPCIPGCPGKLTIGRIMPFGIGGPPGPPGCEGCEYGGPGASATIGGAWDGGWSVFVGVRRIRFRSCGEVSVLGKRSCYRRCQQGAHWRLEIHDKYLLAWRGTIPLGTTRLLRLLLRLRLLRLCLLLRLRLQ